jgi:hydrogenase nickel incorporation protein HypA/HybF
MHELGIVINIVKQMEDYMNENNLTRIEKLVLQVGQLSEIYPKYLMDVYPLAVEGTKLEKTELVIDETPGLGRCKSCDFVYNLVENENECPLCSLKEFSVISGREFTIKEIHAY